LKTDEIKDSKLLNFDHMVIFEIGASQQMKLVKLVPVSRYHFQ